jgi:hypothetical protein
MPILKKRELTNFIKNGNIPSVVTFVTRNAGVLELADETDSKSVVRKGVWVQVPPPAQKENRFCCFSEEMSQQRRFF